jgi:A nuclease family of the HNH/ENDO VII superfamily with conserved AHH
MTQIGEPLAIGEVDVDQVECPFDHDEEEPPTVENDLIGKGSTLASRMKSAKGTHLYAKIKDRYKVKSILNPKHISGHPFFKKNKIVKLDFKDGKKTIVHRYPVSCAAHHCIPAQESLKESALLAYMCKQREDEPLKDGSFSSGLVWSDVGYDVNGSQNGIYLPGSYAVGGGRGGMDVWGNNEDGDEDEPEDGEDMIADPDSNELEGPLYVVSQENRKWQYVKQAVKLCPGQFHDRHVDYSNRVLEVLEKIFENYDYLNTEKIDNLSCQKCKERKKKIKKSGIPTPYGLVERLNKVSDKFKNCLNGTTWRRNIYTSGWGDAYMDAVKSKNPAVS